MKFDFGEKKLTFFGKRKRYEAQCERDIELPIDDVDKPEEWTKLHPDFAEAISIVQTCALKSPKEDFWKTSINITPEWIEACEDFQFCRWSIETKLEENVLVRGGAIKQSCPLGMVDFAVSNAWFHLRNAEGLIFSCRRYIEDYPDLEFMLNVEGDTISLPKSLVTAAERAAVLSQEDGEGNRIRVDVKEGKLKISGIGVSGKYEEFLPLRYTGRPFSFLVNPKVLSDVADKHNECTLSEKRLKVDTGKFVYVACLLVAEEKKKAKKKSKVKVAVGADEEESDNE